MSRRKKHIQVQEGDGIVDWAKNIWSALKGPRLKGSPDVRNKLEKLGNNYITQINVYREPLSDVIKKVVDAVANKPFDKLFHLYILVALDDGNIYKIEKNEVVSFKPFSLDQVKPDAEFETVDINKNITINEFFANGIKYMGNDKFWLYSATKNNCQDFITGLLKGNGLGNASVYSFIKQDTQDIVSDFWGSVGDTITDLAARFDILQNGDGVQQPIKRQLCKF